MFQSTHLARGAKLSLAIPATMVRFGPVGLPSSRFEQRLNITGVTASVTYFRNDFKDLVDFDSTTFRLVKGGVKIDHKGGVKGNHPGGAEQCHRRGRKPARSRRRLQCGAVAGLRHDWRFSVARCLLPLGAAGAQPCDAL